MSIDAAHMQRALRLGHRALGTTAENPPVGCVIAKGPEVLGVGWTHPSGRPHAETEALAMAGSAARGSTAYVTLEPCAHVGRTGPCARALAQAGVARVVIACGDPDPRVNGQGVAMLREAGIAVEMGTPAGEPEDLAGFLTRVRHNRPLVLLKLAISPDGMIASGPGQRTQISGPAAQARVHLMRAHADAILVGAGTLATDDPSLTCRLPDLETRSPQRFVAAKRIPAGAKCQPAEMLDTSSGLPAALAELAERGINRLMVEGGAALARSFLMDGIVDEVVLIRSANDLGPQGVAAPLDEIHARFIIAGLEWLGPDRLIRYERRG